MRDWVGESWRESKGGIRQLVKEGLEDRSTTLDLIELNTFLSELWDPIRHIYAIYKNCPLKKKNR